MRRRFYIASFALPFMTVCFVAGCRSPDWWAYRSLRCIPESGDASSHSYWENCKNTDEANPAPPTPNPESKSNAQWEAMPTTPSFQGVLAAAPTIQLASHTQGPESNSKSAIRQQNPLKLPLELPGAQTAPLILPRVNIDGSKVDPKTEKENILKLFPEFSSFIIDPEAIPDASLSAIGLEELHRLARENHPGLRAAAASVETARGLMIQSGLPPNPNAGYEADTVRTANTPGYHGAYLQQTFITAQKLGLAA